MRYPFKEGDTYYTIKDGQVIASCWDDQSEEMHTKDSQYYKDKQTAITDLFVYNTLKRYFEDQNTCAIYGDDCIYRGELEDGTKLMCAFGQHIPDEVYNDDMEGKDASTLIDEYGDEVLTEEALNANISASGWDCIQSIHDIIAHYPTHGWSGIKVGTRVSIIDRFEHELGKGLHLSLSLMHTNDSVADDTQK